MSDEYWRLGTRPARRTPARALVGDGARDRQLRREISDSRRTRMLAVVADISVEVDGEVVRLVAGRDRVSPGWAGLARLSDEQFIRTLEPVLWPTRVREKLANGEVRLQDLELRNASNEGATG